MFLFRRMKASGSSWGLAMRNFDLDVMTLEELWALHETIGSILISRIEVEKSKLESRLDELDRRFAHSVKEVRERRPYPKVLPKYQNPKRPSQTWAGRGKKPRWMSKLLDEGMTFEDLRISR